MGATDDRIEVRVSSAAVAGRALGGRASQQDEVLCLHDDGARTHFLVLADGMGGHGGGELAARLVVETAEQLWNEGGWREEPGAVFLERLCQQAHLRLLAHQNPSSHIEPHSTIVCLLIKEQFSFWAHVGDSRLYRYQGREFLGHTQDHSLAQLHAQRGKNAAALAVTHDHDQAYLLTQGLGGGTAPIVDHGCMPTRGDHTFVLCSDGVWAHLSSEELGALVRREERESAVLDALTLALKRGGEQADNASLIFVRPNGASRAQKRGWSVWRSLLDR